MTKVYIAGFFDTRARLRSYRDRLIAGGYDVISTWLNEEDVTYQTTPPAYHHECAIRDLAEVRVCDMFILDTLDESPRGGREVEFGMALMKMIPRYVVGPPRNVFHQLATMRFNTWEDLFAYLDLGTEI